MKKNLFTHIIVLAMAAVLGSSAVAFADTASNDHFSGSDAPSTATPSFLEDEKDSPSASQSIDLPTEKKAQNISCSKTKYVKKVTAKDFKIKAKAKTSLSYESSNKKVATVSQSGVVSVKGKGTAHITIKAQETDAYKAAEKAVMVKVSLLSQKIQGKKERWLLDSSGKVYLDLKAKTPLTYSCSSSVVSVSSKGAVHINKRGCATIKIKAKETSKYASTSCTIKVHVKRSFPRIAVVDYPNDCAKIICTKLAAVGCIPVIVSSMKHFNVNAYDGLALPGGADVTPSLYGAKKDPRTDEGNIQEDRLQLAAIKKFANAKKPILGVCRGQQILNVAFGGTLYQHIDRHVSYRSAKAKPASWIHKIYKSAFMDTVHNHHQCVKKLGKGLIATQWDVKTGVIEAIEHETLPIYAVQWHPDAMEANGLKVFSRFKRECHTH